MIRPPAPALLSPASAISLLARRPFFTRAPRPPPSWQGYDGHNIAGGEDEAGRAPPVRGPDTEPWPLPRSGALTASDNAASAGDHLGGPTSTRHASLSASGRSSRSDGDSMLVLHGLSPNLSITDFHRLGSDHVSNWSRVITKISQQRDRDTLDGVGRYYITFTSSPAAIAYRETLLRLHRLANYKLHHRSGLWESTLPAFLRSPDGSDPAAELEAFTVLPASTSTFAVDRKRVTSQRPWVTRLRQLVERLGYKGEDRPPVVLLTVYPPTVTADDLARLVEEDGDARDLPWRVSKPLSLKAEENARDSGQSSNTRGLSVSTIQKMAGKFILVGESSIDALRFQRHWNNRTIQTEIGGDIGQNLVHASIINW